MTLPYLYRLLAVVTVFAVNAFTVEVRFSTCTVPSS
jgi:hypothetical protein